MQNSNKSSKQPQRNTFKIAQITVKFNLRIQEPIGFMTQEISKMSRRYRAFRLCHELTHCMLGNFSCFFAGFNTFLQEQYEIVKRFGSRSGLTFCQS